MNEHLKREPAKSKNPYFAKAEAHIQASNYKPGEVPVVDRIQNPVEWQEWLDYFAHHGLKHTVQLMNQGASSWTVPSLSPRNFDPVGTSVAVEAGMLRRSLEHNLARHLSAEERKRITARLKPTFLAPAKMKAGEISETYEELKARMRKEIPEAAKASPMVAKLVKEMQEFKANESGIKPPAKGD